VTTTTLTPSQLSPITLRAFKYIRVSSDSQGTEDRNSLETQDARLDAHCAERGYHIAGTFVDVFSGRRDDRKKYQDMLARLRRNEADVVTVVWLDRFGRNPREILSRYWELEERGVRVEASDEDIQEEIVLLIKAWQAGGESRKIGERVRLNMPRAIEKGIRPGPRPFGYKADRGIVQYADKNGHTRDKLVQTWKQDPTEAAVVRRMYELAVVKNMGYKAIADTLNNEGYKTRIGKLWTSYGVSQVLNNETLGGVYTYAGKRYEGFFPAILTPDEWAALRKRAEIRQSARGKTHVSEYLLSGIARCGNCGGPLVSTVHDVKGKRYSYYQCSRSRSSAAQCDVMKKHPKAKLEAAVLDYLGQFSDEEKVRELLAKEKPSERAMLEAELVMAQARSKALEDDFLANFDMLKKGIIEEDEFRAANDARRDERKSAQARVNELTDRLATEDAATSGAEALPGRVGTFLQDIQHLDVRENKARLQSLLKAVHVFTDMRIEIEFRV
jgi:site-specific DNA recombinase